MQINENDTFLNCLLFYHLNNLIKNKESISKVKVKKKILSLKVHCERKLSILKNKQAKLGYIFNLTLFNGL